MLTFRLIEPFEPTNENVSDGSRFAITHCGEAHLELALDEPVYLEQMAMVTGYRFQNVQEQVSLLSRNMSNADNRDGIRRVFVDYIVKEDQRKLTVPNSTVYTSLHEVRRDFAGAVERTAG